MNHSSDQEADQATHRSSWNQVLAGATKDVTSLLNQLEIPLSELSQRQQACLDFPLLVPQPFIDKMEKGNANDPLLLQVLPQSSELDQVEGFINDPLAEKHSNLQKGLIHKYHGRVLVLLSTGCAVNCRYCFRRHFPYQENRIGKNDWQGILDYVAQDNSIEELILSGGDPLMLNDQQLERFIKQAEAIPHLQRLRIHTRLPVVIPQRITDKLIEILQSTRFDCAIVLHINHASEIDERLRGALSPLTSAGIILLNQAVLLRGVNDTVKDQVELSKALFKARILPYYLHLLDKVKGAHHFEVDEKTAQDLHQQLLLRLSGYLVPKLVREEPGKGSKTPVPSAL
ncbi:EF-P beta-lysylation protein EpmB [Oleispira antarctica]|uniref:L-lysine 2,3-aminomutase n=1 Tax=Oleispira antarctica TaxID=188908 RepID=A0A1Y5HBJ3_OLEAN|nr:EF-P beta-lysylation protein EpmB [Oleispira antarctica]